jgi:hypothetical protein
MANARHDALQRQDNKPEEDELLGDIVAKVATAVADEVDDRRRRGLPIVVDRGIGVEILKA